MYGAAAHIFPFDGQGPTLVRKEAEHGLQQFTASGSLQAGQPDHFAFSDRQVDILKTVTAVILQFKDRFSELPPLIEIRIGETGSDHHLRHRFGICLRNHAVADKGSVPEYRIAVGDFKDLGHFMGNEYKRNAFFLKSAYDAEQVLHFFRIEGCRRFIEYDQLRVFEKRF